MVPCLASVTRHGSQGWLFETRAENTAKPVPQTCCSVTLQTPGGLTRGRTPTEKPRTACYVNSLCRNLLGIFLQFDAPSLMGNFVPPAAFGRGHANPSPAARFQQSNQPHSMLAHPCCASMPRHMPPMLVRDVLSPTPDVECAEQ
jgi:hypothetical protein